MAGEDEESEEDAEQGQVAKSVAAIQACNKLTKGLADEA